MSSTITDSKFTRGEAWTYNRRHECATLDDAEDFQKPGLRGGDWESSERDRRDLVAGDLVRYDENLVVSVDSRNYHMRGTFRRETLT